MIRLHNLAVVRDGHELLSEITFDFEPGVFYGLLGANGSGKTTLLRCLAGLCPVEAAEVIRTTGSEEDGPMIGMVIQEPQRQLLFPSVREDIAFGPANLELPRRAILERVARWLDALGIQFLYDDDRDTAGLSAGQQQAVALAGILAMQPAILLLDEPTSNLDDLQAASLLRAIGRIRTLAPETTIVLATHDTRLVRNADTVIALAAGRIAFHASAAEALTRERLAPLGIDGHSEGFKVAGPIFVPVSSREIVAASDLSVSVGSPSRPILRAVSLSLRAGTCLGVLGRSGAGKSLLLDVLGGWHRPDAGTVLSAPDARLGVVLQRCEDALFEPVARKEVEVGLRGADPKTTAAEATSVMERFGLGQLAERDVATLSGGERKLLAIASVVATRPNALALDEPFSGLDAAARQRLRGILLTLLNDGVALLLVSHQLEDLSGLAQDYLLVANETAHLVAWRELTPALLKTVGIEYGEDPGTTRRYAD